MLIWWIFIFFPGYRKQYFFLNEGDKYENSITRANLKSEKNGVNFSWVLDYRNCDRGVKKILQKWQIRVEILTELPQKKWGRSIKTTKMLEQFERKNKNSTKRKKQKSAQRAMIYDTSYQTFNISNITNVITNFRRNNQIYNTGKNNSTWSWNKKKKKKKKTSLCRKWKLWID